MNVQLIEQRTGTDCLRCCVAMAAGLPYEVVPDFVQLHGTGWAQALAEWLDSNGRGLVHLKQIPGYIPDWLPLIVKGYPNKDSQHHHCIIMMPDGPIDPHPAKIGIGEIAERYAIIHQPPK